MYVLLFPPGQLSFAFLTRRRRPEMNTKDATIKVEILAISTTSGLLFSRFAQTGVNVNRNLLHLKKLVISALKTLKTADDASHQEEDPLRVLGDQFATKYQVSKSTGLS